ncbi:hypothetical protein Bbelb_101380 [Branchiostoma belcheri]|nr:hypothetical protein Bbelb_101380 [Branchiostoma belcheri]
MTRTKCQVLSLGPRTQSNTDPGGFDAQLLDRHKCHIMRTLSAVACWLLLQSVSSHTTNTTQSPMLNTQNCQQGNGASYRGTTSVTETNRTCQRWDSQTPHYHTRTHVNYPLAGLEHNYCRNPDGWNQVWCYTTDPNQRWENCDVPVCDDIILAYVTCGPRKVTFLHRRTYTDPPLGSACLSSRKPCGSSACLSSRKQVLDDRLRRPGRSLQFLGGKGFFLGHFGLGGGRGEF